MNPPLSSLNVDFFPAKLFYYRRDPAYYCMVWRETPKVFRSSVAAELVRHKSLADVRQGSVEDARRLSPGRARTSSPSEPFHVRIPSLLKLLWLKSTFARQSVGFILEEDDEVCFERGIVSPKRAWFDALNISYKSEGEH